MVTKFEESNLKYFHHSLSTSHLSNGEVPAWEHVLVAADKLPHLLPVWLHHLAVATPGGIELDEGVSRTGEQIFEFNFNDTFMCKS